MRWTGRGTILILLAAATLVPIGTLGWLGVRVLQQDSAIEGQRRADELRLEAGQLALAVERRLADIEDRLTQGDGIQFHEYGLGPGVLYQPQPAEPESRLDNAFQDEEVYEFQRKDLSRAARAYRNAARLTEPSIRAEALVRLGRVLRRQGDITGALAAYSELEALGSTPVGGEPAAMIARQVRYRITKQAADLEVFREALYSGMIRMDRGTFEFYQDLLREWGGKPQQADRIRQTEAAIALWRRWKAGTLASRGRETIGTGEDRFLALWVGDTERVTARLIPFSELQALLEPLARTEGLVLSFADGPAEDGTAVLTPGETRLPFLLRVSASDDWANRLDFGSARTLLIAGLGFTFALMLAAAYLLYRVTTREMALVQQQADFVSAVSHEFRTPLTSMRHLTELLETNNVPSEERKGQYYHLLAQETERLHRMVESLLSFGRMQAGRAAWRLEETDIAELVDEVAREFRNGAGLRDREIRSTSEENLAAVRVDREALSRALSNLIENADKYSELGAPIQVAVRRSGDAVEISVSDQGPGIPRKEQKRLFDRFVRGDEARRTGVRGIGVGLALVKSVVEAHGGSVRVVSEPGEGSTFTLRIPCHAS